jgi:hypothetical protein
MNFNDVSPDVFWISITKKYPVISEKAINILLQFSTSYICEQAFSCVTNIKSKERNHLLSVEVELQVCLSKIWPRLQICSETNKPKCHIESKPYIRFGCELYFDV